MPFTLATTVVFPLRFVDGDIPHVVDAHDQVVSLTALVGIVNSITNEVEHSIEDVPTFGNDRQTVIDILDRKGKEGWTLCNVESSERLLVFSRPKRS